MRQRFTKANVEDTRELVYDYIVEFINENGFAPSIREMCEGTGIRSTSTIHSHLKRLQEEGRLTVGRGKRRALTVTELEQKRVDHVPLVGRVTAGAPILADENIERSLPIVADYYRDAEKMFALTVKGDSMVGAAILDGDIVFVREQPVADFGDIIVALIDDEATVKTFHRHEGKIVLKPENPTYDMIAFDKEGCRILGVVVGIWRPNV
jgi:repressor LexA